MIFCCKLRVSEAWKLKIEDVDLESGKTIICQSKGMKDRIVFIPEDLIPLCNEYLALLEKRYGVQPELFFSKTNDFLNLYLPSQAIRSANTISTYQDGLTIFRRYVTNTKKVSIRKFKFSVGLHSFP